MLPVQVRCARGYRITFRQALDAAPGCVVRPELRSPPLPCPASSAPCSVTGLGDTPLCPKPHPSRARASLFVIAHHLAHSQLRFRRHPVEELLFDDLISLPALDGDFT